METLAFLRDSWVSRQSIADGVERNDPSAHIISFLLWQGDEDGRSVAGSFGHSARLPESENLCLDHLGILHTDAKVPRICLVTGCVSRCRDVPAMILLRLSLVILSSSSPRDAILIELAKAAGFPDGVINIVPGGASTVDSLINALEIRALSFVGGNRVGEYSILELLPWAVYRQTLEPRFMPLLCQTQASHKL